MVVYDRREDERGRRGRKLIYVCTLYSVISKNTLPYLGQNAKAYPSVVIFGAYSTDLLSPLFVQHHQSLLPYKHTMTSIATKMVNTKLHLPLLP